MPRAAPRPRQHVATTSPRRCRRIAHTLAVWRRRDDSVALRRGREQRRAADRAVSGGAVRPRDRPHAHPLARDRRRVSPGGKPRWQVARVRHTHRRARSAQAPRPEYRRRTLARDGCATRQLAGPWHQRSRQLSGLGVYAGLEVAHHELRRQDLARGCAIGNGDADSIHCPG